MWPKEIIADLSQVFMRVHKGLLADGEIRPNIFREQKGAMSVDWDKYSTPQESRSRSKIPTDNGIIQMNAGAVRTISGLDVDHDPVQEGTLDDRGRPVSANRAHSLVIGVKKDPQRRIELSRICEWVIRV